MSPPSPLAVLNLSDPSKENGQGGVVISPPAPAETTYLTQWESVGGAWPPTLETSPCVLLKSSIADQRYQQYKQYWTEGMLNSGNIQLVFSIHALINYERYLRFTEICTAPPHARRALIGF